MQKSHAIKIGIYLVLVLLTLFCGNRFVSKYSTLMDSKVDSDAIELAVPPAPPPDTSAPPPETPEATNESSGEPSTSESVPSPQTTVTADVEEAPDQATPETPRTETIGSDETVETVPLTKGAMERQNAPDVSGIAIYAFALFSVILLTGFLAAHDISQILALKTHKLLHNEEGEGVHSVDYDRAEEVWAQGDHLEAIRLMREYLTKHPREVHVMIRIAEIYEKDLGNFLAAALEYEELLTKRLPAEQWGWSAIHLVNLYYGKIGKPDKGLELLWRIHREYGHTVAAEKARKRLRQIDPNFLAEEQRMNEQKAAEEDEGEASFEELHERLDPPTEIPPFDEEEGDSNLPRGFKPKKR